MNTMQPDVCVDRNEKGFTLVELAIVMIIIGLLVTGILKGQEMIANAQVTATIAQVKGIDAATSTFRDIYDAMPGDLTNANRRLPGCTGTCVDDAVSDGNGRVDTLGVGVAITAASENRLFFSHLAAADLLSGVSPTPDATAFSFGEDLPGAEVGGGFGVAFSGGGAPANGGLTSTSLRAGHYLILSSTPWSDLTTTAGAQLLTPSQAARIDRKIDDGAAVQGSVQAGGNTACDNTDTGIYLESDTAAQCNLFIRIQG